MSNLAKTLFNDQVRSVQTLCLNPCLDIAVSAPDLVIGDLNLYESLTAQPGGKGLNVAAHLSKQGINSSTFLAMPETSRGFSNAFADARFGACEYRVPGKLRINIKVNVRQEDGNMVMTEINGTGDRIDSDTAAGLVDMLIHSAKISNVLVLSGSLLPGIPADIYSRLSKSSHEANGITVLDASRAAMKMAINAGVDAFKPNLDEFRQLTGLPCDTIEQVARTSELYCRSKACDLILCSLGNWGAVITDGERTYFSPVPDPDATIVNLTGAGDAMTAVLAAFASTTPLNQRFGEYVENCEIAELLKIAMANAQATVRLPSNEVPSQDQVLSWLPQVAVRPI